MKRGILGAIRLYKQLQLFFSPILRAFLGTDQACRFTPTCSEYTYQAVEKYGSLKGVWLGMKRIARCNPWTPGGHDPVP